MVEDMEELQSAMMAVLGPGRARAEADGECGRVGGIAKAADQKHLASTGLIPRILLIYDFSLAFYERASVWREGTH
jgi:hypothetical protein